MRRILPLLLLAATAGAPPAEEPPPRREPPPPPPRPNRGRAPDPKTIKGPHRVACPRCHAEAGKSCDRRTLGRHHYHKARVDLAKEQGVG
jgi:hypothetical protein